MSSRRSSSRGYSGALLIRKCISNISAADVEPIVIYTDYINMVKFVLEGDNGYKTVSGHLRIMA